MQFFVHNFLLQGLENTLCFLQNPCFHLHISNPGRTISLRDVFNFCLSIVYVIDNSFIALLTPADHRNRRTSVPCSNFPATPGTIYRFLFVFHVFSSFLQKKRALPFPAMLSLTDGRKSFLKLYNHIVYHLFFKENIRFYAILCVLVQLILHVHVSKHFLKRINGIIVNEKRLTL
mgnify:CR=1 FL=1